MCSAKVNYQEDVYEELRATKKELAELRQELYAKTEYIEGLFATFMKAYGGPYMHKEKRSSSVRW